MQITFDPRNPDDLATLARLIDPQPLPKNIGTQDQETMLNVAAMVDAGHTEQPADTPETYPADHVDCHGMLWDAEIHSDPPSIVSDGSWRTRRGKKDEHKAAIAHHRAQQLLTPDAEATDDTPQPAAEAPAIPPEPISYVNMARRFTAMLQAGTLPVGYEQIYTDLGVTLTDLQTNQTAIARLWHYMDGIDEAQDHSGAVRHAMGSV